MEILKYSVVLALATWVVALAGVCVLQNVAPGNSKPLSLTWWHIWLEFAVLVAVLAAVLMKKVESWRLALLALLAGKLCQNPIKCCLPPACWCRRRSLPPHFMAKQLLVDPSL